MTPPAVRGGVISSGFFIDAEGKIKLSTMGMLSQADINKILDAK
jgi:hypothetical protein